MEDLTVTPPVNPEPGGAANLQRLQFTDPRILTLDSKLGELRKSYPKLDAALSAVEKDLRTVDAHVRGIAKAVEEASKIPHDAPDRRARINALCSEHTEALSNRTAAFTTTFKPRQDLLEAIGDLPRRLTEVEVGHSIGWSYANFLNRILRTETEAPLAQLAQLSERASTPRKESQTTPVSPEQKIEIRQESIRYRLKQYFGDEPPSMESGNPIRNAFRESDISLSGKLSVAMGKKVPSGLNVNLKFQDWQNFGSVNGQFSTTNGYEGISSYPSEKHSDVMCAASEKWRGGPPPSPYPDPKEGTGVHFPVGIITIKLTDAKPESGVTAVIKRVGKKPHMNMLITISPPSVVDTVEGHQRVDSRAFSIGAAMPVPRELGEKFHAAIERDSDAEQKMIWHMFDSPPSGKAGDVVRWLRDYTVAPVAEAVLGTTGGWDNLSYAEQSFALRHLVITEEGELTHDDLLERWDELRKGVLASTPV